MQIDYIRAILYSGKSLPDLNNSEALHIPVNSDKSRTVDPLMETRSTRPRKLRGPKLRVWKLSLCPRCWRVCPCLPSSPLADHAYHSSADVCAETTNLQ